MPEALSFRVTVNYKNEAGKEKGNVMYIKVFMPPLVKYFKVMSIKAIDVVNSGKYGNLHFTSNLEKYTSLFTLMSSTHISPVCMSKRIAEIFERLLRIPHTARAT